MRALLLAAAMTITPASKSVLKRRRSAVSPISFNAFDDFLRAIEAALGGDSKRANSGRADAPRAERLDWTPETLSVRR